MRTKSFLAFSALLAFVAQAQDGAATKQVELQTAMLNYMDSILVDGGYSYVDTKTDSLSTVYPANVHPFVVSLGDDYVVCSEMIDESGNTVTADFLVRRIGGDYRVVQMILDDRESVQGAMSKLKK